MSRASKKLDRSSLGDAEAVLSSICPDATLRLELLRCLLASISFVDRVAPQAWAVTLFESGFRLNVGQVEALTCGFFPEEELTGHQRPLEVRVLTQGELPADLLSAAQRDPSSMQVWSMQYRSVPAPQHAVTMSSELLMELAEWHEKLWPFHQRYLAAALRTESGRLRSKTTFRRTHSPGLVDYAMTFCRSRAVVPSAVLGDELSFEEEGYFEGRPVTVQTTRYERDRDARRACIAHHGYSCAACGFSFGAMYGPVADHYIQVHHLDPLASQGGRVAINPIHDMLPLCANCHAVAHFKSPPYTVEEVRSFINKEHKS